MTKCLLFKIWQFGHAIFIAAITDRLNPKINITVKC